MKYRTVFCFSGFFWFSIGTMLLYRGVSNMGADPLIFLPLSIGCLKGKFILRRTAQKVISQTLSLKEPVYFWNVYFLKDCGLIGVMMGLSFLLKTLPIPFQVRGFISLTIGSALITGSLYYFRQTVVARL